MIPFQNNQVLEFTEDTLMGVQDLAATDFAFAAICGEQRSVVTWGSPHYGGDSNVACFFGPECTIFGETSMGVSKVQEVPRKSSIFSWDFPLQTHPFLG